MIHRKIQVRFKEKEKVEMKFCFLESPTQIGDDYSFDEPFMMRSIESMRKTFNQISFL